MRRGFGSSLVRWGLSVAKEDKLVFPVLASSMGIPLYRNCGFKSLGHTFVQVPGETETSGAEIMVFDAHKQPSVEDELQGAKTRCAMPLMT